MAVMQEFVARLLRLPDDTLTALAFFSRLPTRRMRLDFDLKTGAGAWPVTGLIVAAAPAALLFLARMAGIPAMVDIMLALALYAALTGAMHEDGLSDTFDGLGGGRSREAKLAIMRDSRLGTYGALAVLFTTLVKLGCLTALEVRPGHTALALLLAAIVSRALALLHWAGTPPARHDGMAAAAGRPDDAALIIGLIVGGIAALGLFAVFGIVALVGIGLAAAGVWLFSGFVVRQIDGHTGDTVGAAQQIIEALIYVGLTVGGPSILA
jgi:adenosylcobinamide-GDP ribazoletransferase